MSFVSGHFFGSCSLTLADFEHGVRHEPRTRRWLRLAIPVALVFAGLAATSWWLGFPLAGAVLLLGALFAVGSLGLPEQVARRWFDRTPKDALDFKFTVTGTGFIAASPAGNRYYPWEGMHGFAETPECFLLWVTESLFLIVPKRAFQPEELPRIGRLLVERVPPLEPLYRSHLILLGKWLLVLAAVLGLFAALAR